eukprot:TRINITY_DN1278_c0_g1_i2.p1 TRINITY_DN1278_c0_g1~~TRINITY_DN1278_c0_g1_i2.p1  ORF type:complete len:134 (-),score=13.96 TRINITY_DN1278_c0_g1_i2:486-887(-)
MEDVEAQFDDNITVIERMEGENSTVEIEEYDELRGRPNVMTDTNSLQTYKKLGIKLQRIKITLHGDGGFRCRQGALHYMIGDIDITAKNKIKGKIKPRFHGDGVVCPLFLWFFVICQHRLCIKIHLFCLIQLP